MVAPSSEDVMPVLEGQRDVHGLVLFKFRSVLVTFHAKA